MELFMIAVRRFFLFLIFLLTGCAPTPRPDGPPPFPVDVNKVPNAQPIKLPLSRYGNPPVYVINGKKHYVLKTARGYRKVGIASWYGMKFYGQLTASREPYDLLAMTAASPDLPIPSFVKVTNLENKKSIIVKVNDRGPFASGRIIDLSYVAAKKLSYVNKGTALVEVKSIFPEFRKKTTPLISPRVVLQLGAFRELPRAKHLQWVIQSHINTHVRVIKGTYRHTTIYRVQIGPFIKAQSLSLTKKLKALGFRNIHTLRY